MCNAELLANYGVIYQDENFQQQLDIENQSGFDGFFGCPKMNFTCCTNQQLYQIKSQWDITYKYFFEQYYESYLLTVKYLLGYSVEMLILAQATKTS